MALKAVDPGRALALLLKKIKEMPAPSPGERGKQGKDGITKTITETIHVQEDGKPGQTGAAPEHEVRNGEIRFKQPNGTWGKWIQVQPSSAGGGIAAAVSYVPVAQANFKVNRTSLIEGTNIFGVNFAAEVELILPSGISKNIIIVIKDESNNASSNNITITTENQT